MVGQPGADPIAEAFSAGFNQGAEQQKKADFVRLSAMASGARTKAAMAIFMDAARRIRELPAVGILGIEKASVADLPQDAV